MSLLKTKPSWAPTAVATSRGWQDPVTNEVYVAIGNLDILLEKETPTIVQVVEEIKEEIVMNQVEETQEAKVKRAYNKKPKVIGEVVEQPVRQIIAEVVEYDVDTKVIGE